MDPRDFLEVANALVVGITQAEWRSAVSRGYYAAFHVARRLLKNCGFSVPYLDQAHTYLSLRLANSGHVDVVRAGNELNYLRGSRNRADYDLNWPLGQSAAAGNVLTAESIIQLLELVEADALVRTRITDAMKIYERDVLGQVTWHP
jgi:uncharacterized protein (UPF0332 family)